MSAQAATSLRPTLSTGFTGCVVDAESLSCETIRRIIATAMRIGSAATSAATGRSGCRSTYKARLRGQRLQLPGPQGAAKKINYIGSEQQAGN